MAGARQTLDDGADADAALGVTLLIEEELGARHAVGGGAFEVGHHHLEEVALVDQHRGTGDTAVEKGLPVGEGVRGP